SCRFISSRDELGPLVCDQAAEFAAECLWRILQHQRCRTVDQRSVWRECESYPSLTRHMWNLRDREFDVTGAEYLCLTYRPRKASERNSYPLHALHPRIRR